MNPYDKPSLDELAHFGVKGMKWGVRNNKNSASAYAKKRVRKETQNQKLVKKIVKTENKSAKTYKKLTKAQSRILKSGPIMGRNKGTAEKARKLNRLYRKHSKYTSRLSKYKNTVYKNEKIISKLGTKVNQISSSDIARGKAIVDASLTK